MMVGFGLWCLTMLAFEFKLASDFLSGRFHYDIKGASHWLQVELPLRRVSPVSPVVICVVSAALLAIEACRRWIQFSGSGTSVALSLGGRWIEPETERLEERRLINVVEEVAIAAGVRAPSVFLLDHQAGINAFAAGTRRDLAAIVLTRGALDYLTRDELQGLVAHEMSHIINADMTLNLYMIGMVSAMLVFDRVASRIDRFFDPIWTFPLDEVNLRNPLAAIVVGGFALIFWILHLFIVRLPLLIGAAGVLVARYFQAAVNRSREELADASAMQFTRNPGGIAGVLKKIGGLPEGGKLYHELTPLMNHMFFETPRPRGKFSLETHPPLVERIRKLDPSFEGHFVPPRPMAEVSDVLYGYGHAVLNDRSAPEAVQDYRRRAEALIDRAREVIDRYESRDDPELRTELKRLEALRRDLWIDAGQVARASQGWPPKALSNGFAPPDNSTLCRFPARLWDAYLTRKWTPFNVIGFFFKSYVLVMLLAIFLYSLSIRIGNVGPVDPRLVGAWTSPDGETTYELHADGTFSYRLARPAAARRVPCTSYCSRALFDNHGVQPPYMASRSRKPEAGKRPACSNHCRAAMAHRDVPVDGWWGVTVVKNQPKYALAREPLTLHLSNNSGWRMHVALVKLARDEITTPLPPSIAYLTLGGFSGMDLAEFLTYHRTQ